LLLFVIAGNEEALFAMVFQAVCSGM